MSEGGGFEDYIPTSMDPGNSMLIATVLFCVLLIAFLPCLFSMAKRLQKQHGEAASTDSSGEDDTKSKDNTEQVQEKLQNKTTTTTNNTKLSKSELKQIAQSSGASSVNGGAVPISPYHNNNNKAQPQQPPSSNNDDNSSSSSDANSVHTTRSTASVVLNALLTAAPHANPVRTQIKHHKVQREQQTEDDLHSVGGSIHCLNNPNESGDGNDILGKLSQDEVSIRDAVDVDSVSRGALSGLNNNDNNSNSCCHRLQSSFDQLLVIAEWNYESKRICKLGIPFVSQALVEGVCEAVRVAIIGQTISTAALAAYVVVDMMVGLTTQCLSGFQNALATLCSHAVGGERQKLAGQYVQIATICYALCFVPIFVFWAFFVDDVIRWFGFDEETVAIGQDFAILFLFAEFLRGICDSVHGLLTRLGAR